ncbi:1-phosphatidylinositol 4,5-bisphosphate phosphodiesterase delta-1a isoform X1 [Lepisosteus oculatus]|uniref:1-phosphatidylinositol 4,5-bisphosphate phosphodiesterase delta-1a isoform X1 n=1 Tax=Lepisosteus oculatus TaxID=7918 RepID=UPI0037246366
MQCVRRQPKRTKSEEIIFQQQSKKTALENGKRLGLEGDEDLKFLLTGGNLKKVKSSSWRKMRFYKLQEDCKTIWYNSQKPVKSRGSQTFSIDDIEDVRFGRQSEGMKKYTEGSLEDFCFSIIFKGHRKNLDLIADSPEEAKQWVTSLEKIIEHTKSMNQQQNREHWIYSCMRKADKNHDNKMTLKEMKSFLKHINFEVNESYADLIFVKCDKSRSGTLEGSEIEEFYKILTYRQEIDVIYTKYAQTEGKMSPQDLAQFLQHEQLEAVTASDACSLIEKYEVDEEAKQKRQMTKDGFLIYLQSPLGMVFNPAHSVVYQDMTQPLNHYFISSSHNTYLMEDQLKGPSSPEAYIRALLKSCRCVELDCWDGPDKEPVIYHGYTLTSKVLFKDVISTIKQYAFKKSQYPVILSLENHCCVEQQEVMAYHLKNILGDALVTAPLRNKMPTDFPSPDQLKGKFLIKGKRLNKLESFFEDNTIEEEFVSEEDEAADVKVEQAKEKPSKRSKIKLAKELSDLVIYCKSVHFPGFESAREKQSFYEMASFKEGKAEKLALESANAYVCHNIDKLSRIYPAGSRTDSSNYNPVNLWNVGCQIVALNFQTSCKEMDLNQGKFMQNGFCGYVLKPEFLRDRSSQFNPYNLKLNHQLKPKILHVMIISAQQLPKVKNNKDNSIVDPLVKVQIEGVPDDQQKQQTEYIQNNGLNPMWNESFRFKVCVPELALLRFVVEDHDVASHNDFIGQYTLPFTSLQNGYRHVPLLKKNGNLISSTSLFVHIMVMDSQ